MNVPVASVVIPCFNHARFLADAIRSAVGQTWPAVEVIVIDDASTDDSASIARQFPEVRLHQRTRAGGLACARNAGLELASGEYVAFLDADDFLLADGLAAGIRCLGEHAGAALAFGSYQLVGIDGVPYATRTNGLDGTDLYLRLLGGNVVGMFATVLFRRKAVVECGGFDVKLEACEDYDLLLRLSRTLGAAGHRAPVAAYRRHPGNMSRRYDVMLRTSLQALGKQAPYLEGPAKARYQEGLQYWKHLYGTRLLDQARQDLRAPRNVRRAGTSLLQLLRRVGLRDVIRWLRSPQAKS